MHWRLPILSFLVVLFLGLCAHARPVQVVDDRQYTLGMVIINTPRVNEFVPSSSSIHLRFLIDCAVSTMLRVIFQSRLM
jgi:hypothetical protein